MRERITSLISQFFRNHDLGFDDPKKRKLFAISEGMEWEERRKGMPMPQQ